MIEFRITMTKSFGDHQGRRISQTFNSVAKVKEFLDAITDWRDCVLEKVEMRAISEWEDIDIPGVMI